jgi:hypothetical protein
VRPHPRRLRPRPRRLRPTSALAVTA